MHPGYFHVKFSCLLLLSLKPLYCNRFSHNLLLQQLQIASPTITSGLLEHAICQFALAMPYPTPLQQIWHEPIAAAAANDKPCYYIRVISLCSFPV